MTGAEWGWLLLCADLGDGMKPLTLAQVRSLRLLIRQSKPESLEPNRDLSLQDLLSIGCDRSSAEHILQLLNREASLKAYLYAASEHGIYPVTRSSPDYPSGLLRLGDRAPGVLFCRGNRSLLGRDAVCLTGSRNLSGDGAAFARRVGRIAAEEDCVLISGNARGADHISQDSCLEAGGSVIAVLPGPLWEQKPVCDRQLFLCEEGWQLPFSTHRALHRNRLIYGLARIALVAEAALRGGTYRGASDALRNGVLPVYVREDSGAGCEELVRLGADPVSASFTSFRDLRPSRCTLWDQQAVSDDFRESYH